MNRSSVVDIFLNAIYIIVFKGTTESMIKFLRNGPAGKRPEVKDKELSDWYNKFDEHDKEMVNQVVNRSIYMSIFTILVILDNKAGGDPVKNISSDYSLYYQEYADEKNKFSYNPSNAIRLNMSYSGDDLHDRFMEIVENS